MHSGRVPEVADILASRLRSLTVLIEKKAPKLARHFLCYKTQEHSLCSDELMDAALRIQEEEAKRERKIAAIRGTAAPQR